MPQKLVKMASAPQCFVQSTPSNLVLISVVPSSRYDEFLNEQPETIQNWLTAQEFSNKVGAYCSIPSPDMSAVAYIVAIVDDTANIWSLAHLPNALPANATYKIDDSWLDDSGDSALGLKGQLHQFALGWGLACYRYEYFKESTNNAAPLFVDEQYYNFDALTSQLESLSLVRSLITTPANYMTPEALAEVAQLVAQESRAKVKITEGDRLLKNGYPAIHAVGRAAEVAPRLVDFTWGKESHPKVTLVGKGVCFDSGGLDLKPSSGMLLMKKDMGGAAAVLGLAKMIMDAKLPVRLRVLIPAVENSVAGNAFRPMDVLDTRHGMSVEVGNTDAEGRLILCDALFEADSETPDLLIDCATLTGAARVALGTDIPAFFTDDAALASDVMAASNKESDPLWQLPLYMEYDKLLKSDIADVNNVSAGGFGGAITAALFLKRFISNTQSWMHVDMMAWNTTSRAGRPKGGEAMGIRALFTMIQQRYSA